MNVATRLVMTISAKLVVSGMSASALPVSIV